MSEVYVPAPERKRLFTPTQIAIGMALVPCIYGAGILIVSILFAMFEKV